MKLLGSAGDAADPFHLRDTGLAQDGDLLHIVTTDNIPARRVAFGRMVIWGSAGLLILLAVVQSLQEAGQIDLGFQTWRPTLYAYVFWAVCLCWGQVLTRGEQGKRTLFVLPAVLFVLSLAILPLIFGLGIAFSDWNLSSPDGRKFNGLDNVRQMWGHIAQKISQFQM